MQRYYSNVFWHFTGSPRGIDWSKVHSPAELLQIGSPAEPVTGTSIALQILATGKLLASCSEQVAEEHATDRFCCVTDIPIKDLPIHSRCYGKVAIGFKASFIHKAFQPVMYVPSNRLPPGKVRTVPSKAYLDVVHDALYERGDWDEAMHYEEMAMNHPDSITTHLDLTKTGTQFLHFVKVTEFSPNPEHTFYSEREWRHLGDFHFPPHAVAAIVAPEAQLKMLKDYLAADVRYATYSQLSVFSWELIENV